MKKYLLLFSALFVLAACNSENNDSKENTADSTIVTTDHSKQSTSSSTKNSSTADTTSVTQTKPQNESSQTNSSHENHALSAMEELQANYPERFPDPATISGGKPIGIAVSEESQLLTVTYYVVEKATPLNDPILNDQSPIAQFQRKIFSTKEAAKDEVGQTYDPNGQPVDLGYDITGYQTAGAGSSFLMWQEGNWSLAVHANNLEQESPLPLAKQTVEYFERVFLPIPHEVGQISFRVTPSDYQANQVVWQDNQTVYTIMNADSMSSLKMAVSMTK